MVLSESQILEELHKVVDPELFVNIVDLGLVYRIDILPMETGHQTGQPSASAEIDPIPQSSDADINSASGLAGEASQLSEAAPSETQTKYRVKIEMTMTSPMCPAGPQLIASCKHVVGQLPEVGDVEVKIVLDPPWTPDRMTEAARDQLGIF